MKIEINKYIDWMEIWSEEIFLDALEKDDYEDEKTFGNIQLFKEMESELGLEEDDCELQEDCILFTWGCSSNHNEGNPQGDWSSFTFVVDSDFNIKSLIVNHG